MGCCCTKEGGSCCLFMCCCPGDSDGKSGQHNRGQRLPESVPTHDLTAHKRPKVHLDTAMTTTTASFMNYAQRHEHPTELEREPARKTEPDNLQYLRLDDEAKVPKGEPEVVRYNIADLPEQATKL